MTLTVALDNYTGAVITNAESTTGWACPIGGVSPVLEQDIFVQGSAAVSFKFSSKTGICYYDIGAGNELDFTGNQSGELFYMWLSCTTISILNTFANNGLCIMLGTTTANYARWRIASNTDSRNFREGKGGFVCFVLDPTTTPSNSVGVGLDLTSVRYFGLYASTTGTAKAENLIIDTMFTAKGIRVTGTHTDGWDDMIDYCTDYANRAWGVIDWDDSKSLVYVKGKITIGSTTQTATTSLVDDSKKFKWLHTEYYDVNDQWMPMVQDEYGGVVVEDASTYPTEWTDGIIVGSDNGRSGSSFEGNDILDISIDLYGGSEATSYTKLYNTQFRKCSGGITWGNDADHLFYGGVVDQCGQFDPVGGPIIRNCSFSSTVDLFEDQGPIDACHHYDDSTTSYKNETVDINDAVPGDVLIPEDIDDMIYFGMNNATFKKLTITTAFSGPSSSSITWEYWNGSTWASLSDVVDGTNNFYIVPGTYDVTWTIPSDWTTTTVRGDVAYYIRAHQTWDNPSPTGTPDATQGWADVGGSAVVWNSSINIQKSSFIANPHGIEHPAAGTFGYTDLIFSGNYYDIHFTPASGNLIINATDSDPSTSENESSGSVTINVAADVDIEVVDPSDTAIVGARVFVEADSGGAYPSYEVVTITSSGTTATVDHTGHGVFDGQLVCIRGATNSEYYNGVFTISYIDVDSYSYTMGGDPPDTATGTITATFVLMNELTIAGGLATESVKVVGTQPIQGYVRYQDTPTHYKEGPLSGDFDSDGYSAKITLIDDS